MNHDPYCPIHHFQQRLMLLLLLITSFATTTTAAEDTTLKPQPKDGKPRVDLTIETDATSGMVDPNSPVRFTAKLFNNESAAITGTLHWRVNSTAITPSAIEQEPIQLGAGQTKESTKMIHIPKAGFIEMVCDFQLNGSTKPIQKKIRVGCNPRKLLAPLTRQDNFNQFWERAIAELKRVDPAFKSIEKPSMSDDRKQVFEVRMRSHNQVRVRGWLEVPRKALKPMPAVIRLPGYGQNMKPVGNCKDMIVFSFNPRGHGNSQQDISGQPNNFWIRGLDQPETYYYLGSYLDCVRAVDFIASRPDVDQDKIAVWGGSQGGGFAFATAAIDPRVDYCVADIPFLCDWSNYFRLTHWPEMNDWIAAKPHRTWESTLRTLSYFDTMNLADRIQCRTLMSVGLQDGVCPPTTCFTTYNRIPGEKQYRIYADKRHGLGKEHTAWVWTQIREAFTSDD